MACSKTLTCVSLAACGKTQKYVIPNPVRFLNGVRNLLFPWFSCEQQIPHPQTTRVRDDKSDFFRSLLVRYWRSPRPILRDASEEASFRQLGSSSLSLDGVQITATLLVVKFDLEWRVVF
jgi:hypothetical protein